MVIIERSPDQGVQVGPYTLWVLAVHANEVVIALLDPDKDCIVCGEPTPGARCPICGLTDLRACPDLGDEAIGDALDRGGQVELLEAPGELRADGGMGAVLRFKPLQPSAPSPETRSRTGER